MKSIIKSNFERNHLLFLLSLIILFTTYSCEKNSTDDESLKFYGTWRQTFRAIDDVSTTLDSTRLIIQINSNNICILYDSSYASIASDKVIIRSGWSYNNGLLNIAVDIPASWTVTVNNGNMNMERIDFSSEGEIVTTTLQYQKIADIEQEQSE